MICDISKSRVKVISWRKLLLVQMTIESMRHGGTFDEIRRRIDETPSESISERHLYRALEMLEEQGVLSVPASKKGIYLAARTPTRTHCTSNS